MASRKKLKREFEWGPDPRNQVPVENRTAFNKKKNTKKWCRGKVGVEHQPTTCIPKNSHRSECYLIAKFIRWDHNQRVREDRWLCLHHIECLMCGKELQRNVKECPLNTENYEMYWR